MNVSNNKTIDTVAEMIGECESISRHLGINTSISFKSNNSHSKRFHIAYKLCGIGDKAFERLDKLAYFMVAGDDDMKISESLEYLKKVDDPKLLPYKKNCLETYLKNINFNK